MSITSTRHKLKYYLENGGKRIIEIRGNDSRIGKRVIVDFQGKQDNFNPKLILRKLQSLNKRHQLFSLSLGALMWGFSVRAFLAL